MTRFLQILLLGMLLGSCSSTTIYLVRHAEKAAPDGSMSSDVPLSAAGLERAEALKAYLGTTTLHEVWATQYQRTYQTVKPSADARGLPIQRYQAAEGNALMDSLVNLKGRRLLVAGHSNSVPGMLRHLGLSPSFAGDIPENDYDNLFIIRVVYGATRKLRLEQLTYGKPSP